MSPGNAKITRSNRVMGTVNLLLLGFRFSVSFFFLAFGISRSILEAKHHAVAYDIFLCM